MGYSTKLKKTTKIISDMKDPLINILISLYGEDFREDFEEHLALLKWINSYRLYKHMAIERQCIEDFDNLSKELRNKYCGNNYNDDDCYWSYSEWFKEVFIKDYDKALIEVEQQTIPSNRELCILRLAREAKYKKISFETICKFCREYLVSAEEYTMFFVEYTNTNN